MDNTVYGIDADCEGIAWARFEGGRYAARGTLERQHGGHIVGGYHGALVDFLRGVADEGATVALEDCWLGFGPDGRPHAQTFKALSALQGEILFVAGLVGAEVVLVSPLEWHRTQLTVQRGRDAIQSDSFRRAAELVGGAVLSPHEADAICVGAHEVAGKRATLAQEPRSTLGQCSTASQRAN